MSSRARLEGLLTGCALALFGVLLRGRIAGWVFFAGALGTGGWLVVDILRARPCDIEVIQNQAVDINIRRWHWSSVVVRDPLGNEHRVLAGWPPELWVGHDITASYPGQFPTAKPPLLSGRYLVTLRSKGRVLRTREAIRGRCSFMIPEGEPGWFVHWEGIRVGNADQVTIFTRAGVGARQLRGLQCEVWKPGQVAIDEAARAAFPDDSPPNLIPQVTYPKDFQDGSPLRNGVYQGEWTAWSPAAPVGSQGRRTLVRRFAFEWPSLWEKQPP